MVLSLILAIGAMVVGLTSSHADTSSSNCPAAVRTN